MVILLLKFVKIVLVKFKIKAKGEVVACFIFNAIIYPKNKG